MHILRKKGGGGGQGIHLSTAGQNTHVSLLQLELDKFVEALKKRKQRLTH
jgi:hypothetical protein